MGVSDHLLKICALCSPAQHTTSLKCVNSTCVLLLWGMASCSILGSLCMHRLCMHLCVCPRGHAISKRPLSNRKMCYANPKPPEILQAKLVLVQWGSSNRRCSPLASTPRCVPGMAYSDFDVACSCYVLPFLVGIAPNPPLYSCCEVMVIDSLLVMCTALRAARGFLAFFLFLFGEGWFDPMSLPETTAPLKSAS